MGLAKSDDYTAHRYHNFSDNYTADMDFTANAKLARFEMELGWEAITLPEPIAWRAGEASEQVIVTLVLSGQCALTRKV